jgi:hypothetical protein
MCECFHFACNLKKKRTKLMKMFNEGHRKYEKEIDVIKFMKN